MKKILSLLLLCTSLFPRPEYTKIPDDFRNYFSSQNLTMLAGAFTIGAAAANSSIDQELHDLYQSEIRSPLTNQLVDWWRPMGQYRVFYLGLGVGAIAALRPNTPVGDFSKRYFFNTARAFLVGVGPLHLMRTLTGGSRPSRTTRSSYWKPFSLPHGVSGDTFTGAIPFITLARMTKDPTLKTLCYTLSTLAGIGRLNDSCHYPSQVFLGWMMAYAACESVERTNSNFKLSASTNQVAFAFEY